ncbi:MAG: magnesium transporter, partial [Acidobacteriota bacterium]|nr:magnesium transporter [Acidobacteriota bacterium]
ATRRIVEGTLLRTFLREMGVAAVLGLLYGALLVAGSMISFYAVDGVSAVDALPPSSIIGVSLTLSMLVAALVGSTLPLLLHKIGIDPAISTTPFVTTTTDVFGSLIFLGLATALLAL